jgi:hypothetical protein
MTDAANRLLKQALELDQDALKPVLIQVSARQEIHETTDWYREKNPFVAKNSPIGSRSSRFAQIEGVPGIGAANANA